MKYLNKTKTVANIGTTHYSRIVRFPDREQAKLAQIVLSSSEDYLSARGILRGKIGAELLERNSIGVAYNTTPVYPLNY